MKRRYSILLVLFLLLNLSACGGKSGAEAAAADNKGNRTEATEMEIGTEPLAPDAAARKEIAVGLIGRPVSELYEAIGQPISASYAPSCLVLDGEDGELQYDGFIVYTEKGADYETVYAVF